VVEQFVVAMESDRPSAARRTLSRSLARVMRRSGDAPDLADSHQSILLTCGGRGGLAHFLDLRHPKGSFASRSRIFSRSSSISMVCSPIFSLRRLYSASSAGERFLRPSAPPARKAPYPRGF
jgi:hypothetical protein